MLSSLFKFSLTTFCCTAVISGCNNLEKIPLNDTDRPPIYCVSKHDKCVAKLFGGLHVAPKDDLAVTTQLFASVDQADNIYFEVLNFGNPKYVNAMNYVSAENYRNMIDKALEVEDIPEKMLNEEYLVQLERVYYGANILSIAPILTQVIDQRCGFLRRKGTELAVQERVAGSAKMLYSMETSASRNEDYKESKALAGIQSVELTPQSGANEERRKFPRDQQFVHSIIERTCNNIRNKWLDWMKPDSSKANSSNSSDYFSEASRNRRFVSFIRQGIKLNHSPLVIVGASHLYGNEGLIALLKNEGFNVTVFR